MSCATECRSPVDDVCKLRSLLDSALVTSSVKDGIQQFFNQIPQHFLPRNGSGTACRFTAATLLDKECFHIVVSKLIKKTVPQLITYGLFRELDRDSTGSLSLLEIVRRVRQNDAIPAVQPSGDQLSTRRRYIARISKSEIDAALNQLREHVSRLVRSQSPVLSEIVRAFEQPTHVQINKFGTTGANAITPPEFARLLVEVLKMRVMRETSDAVFARILGDNKVWGLRSMPASTFIREVMPEDFTDTTWKTIRQKEMQKLDVERRAIYNPVTPNAKYDDPSEYGRRHCRAMTPNLKMTHEFRAVHGLQELRHSIRQRLQVKGTHSSDHPKHVLRLFIQASGSRTVLTKPKFHDLIVNWLNVPCDRRDIDLMYESMMIRQVGCGGDAEGLISKTFLTSIFGEEKDFDPNFFVNATSPHKHQCHAHPNRRLTETNGIASSGACANQHFENGQHFENAESVVLDSNGSPRTPRRPSHRTVNKSCQTTGRISRSLRLPPATVHSTRTTKSRI